MTNPFEAPRLTSTADRKAFVFFQRPISPLVFACIFVPIFTIALFIPTVEIFQLNRSWGHVPLWYAYIGLLAPEYWIIAIPIVVAHVVGTIVLASILERLLISRVRTVQPLESPEPEVGSDHFQ